MKIGIYCTNNYPYPLPAGLICANADIAVWEADTLAQMGEDVTLFAPIGTQTKAKLVTFDMLPFSDSKINSLYPHEHASYHYENIMMVNALNHMEKNSFDVFQSHTRPFSVIEFASIKPKLPTVVTIHDPLTDSAYKILPKYNQFKNLHFVSLSLAQREYSKEANWSENVYNGIDINFWKPKQETGKYLLYCGRVMPEKGADLVVQIALKTGLPLKIMGSVYEGHKSFFDEKIRPFLSERIEYLGVVSRNEQVKIYQNALCLLAPIRWPEPFGLVITEAMACGTPVVAGNRGSVAEIVVAGRTGFTVDDVENIDEYIDRIKDLDKINRVDCRKHVEENFSVEKMAQNYLKLYSRLVKA